MNIKSKFISLSATIIYAFTVVGNSFAAVAPFTDLTDLASKEKIISLQERGFIRGTGNNLFSPNTIITASQGIQLIVNSLELNLDQVRFIKEPKATDYFPKANNSDWYADALIIASVNGLDLPSDLDPDQKWTREEFTYHLIQAVEKHIKLPKIKLHPVDIADGNELTINYSGSIQRALAYGVVKLDEEGKFNPKDHISRAAAADQVYNIIEYIKTHLAPVITSEN